MTARISPYLNFRDEARAAMEFYAEVFGAQPTFSTFEEFGMADDPADGGKIMHSQLELPAGGGVLMASDTPAGMPVPEESSASVALFGDAQDAAALRTVFARLSEGGTPGVPMEVAPWGDEFGMCTDRFGVGWMVNVAGPGQG
ncbi:MAG: VOC family protein [Cellulomonas sp.]|jgi:PhnB protein|uniref:VOC family protein n=1 Tax=Cellulomonas sp. TaxID=40001 RepID=UPI0019EA52D1|nr:VOC family protein [Cellulomonas sp.]MBF0687954.1 VOC family protein [Cellulomonas sp.]